MKMYEFDVDYLNEEYMEYYKDVLITRKIVRNIVFVLIFVAKVIKAQAVLILVHYITQAPLQAAALRGI